VKATISPLACSIPVLRALLNPRLGVRTSRHRYSPAMADVASVEPSSTTMTS
jgi:hypothetical protein